MYIADLHIHSRYSRATSRDCTPEVLDLWAGRKGIDILGTGDFTHPAWRAELSEKLVPAEEGLYCLKNELRMKDPVSPHAGAQRFVISGEISSIYKKNGRVRKVHNVILLPGLSEAEALSQRLEAIGNIHSDGRPILGLDSRDLLEITLEVCPRAIFIPAHIWTPHFSMFGAFSGFDTIEECFEDLTPYVHAFETGLSSDPPMNWRLSALDRLQMISNSDAHSPQKLGREANLLDIPMSYEGLYGAIQEGRGLAGTIECFPEEGKYHYDGHRKCHLCLSPREADAYQGKCPLCGKKLTLGVSHRVEQLADRPEGFVRADAAYYESLAPLTEVIAASTGRSAASAKVQKQYEEMLRQFGNEFTVLRETPIEEIRKECGYFISEGISRLRQGKVKRSPGYDGEYGIISLFEPSELASVDGQMTMFSWAGLSGNTDRETQPDGNAQAGREIQASGRVPAVPAATSVSEKELLSEDGKASLAQREAAVTDMTNCAGNRDMSVTDGQAGDVVTGLSFNEEQLHAIRAVAPRIAVIAGPGTGKTKTLVSRIVYLLKERRGKPSDITAVTFTNQAAQEMRTRLKDELGSRKAAGLRIGTFHSICHDLLKEAGEEFTLADENSTLEIAREAAEAIGLKGKPRTLRQEISQRKVSAALGDQDSADIDRAVHFYQERLTALGALDFDDLLLKALELAQKSHTTFPCLFVDEFQDVSPLQYRLIEEWSRGARELFVIGDPNQAIYGFRGAGTDSFERFFADKETEMIRLRKNYRSRPEILTASQEILGDAGMRLIPVRESGEPVCMIQTAGETAEAVLIAKEINRMVGGIDMLDAQEGFSRAQDEGIRSFGDIAVLYRTHRQAELLEDCLKKEGIPYLVAGREEFLEDDCVRGSLAFFKSIQNPADQLSKSICRRLLWKEKKDSDFDSTYDALAEKYQALLRRGKPQNIWKAWNEDLGWKTEEAMKKLASMAVFYKTMPEMLTALAFGRESDLKRCGGKTYTADAVTLMTMHGSKGLEFPAVILYGVREGIVPLEYHGRETDMEEERRLLYVAMTRAKEELMLTGSGTPSAFLKSVPEHVIHRETIRQKPRPGDGGHQMSLFDLFPCK